MDGKELKRVRKHLRLSQAELAVVCRVRRQTISELENGKYKVDGPMVALITLLRNDPKRLAELGVEWLEPVPPAEGDSRKQIDAEWEALQAWCTNEHPMGRGDCNIADKDYPKLKEAHEREYAKRLSALQEKCLATVGHVLDEEGGCSLCGKSGARREGEA